MMLSVRYSNILFHTLSLQLPVHPDLYCNMDPDTEAAWYILEDDESDSEDELIKAATMVLGATLSVSDQKKRRIADIHSMIKSDLAATDLIEGIKCCYLGMETIRCGGIEASNEEELAGNHIDDDDERVTSVRTITGIADLPKRAVLIWSCYGKKHDIPASTQIKVYSRALRDIIFLSPS
ncbi:hypothetical protein BDN70DRAFT_975722 [Pholiota conissans]|uniref:Uncharacterized protein n=1 Tax=Pholiota conissans TaxID=109636 RepID=A0A9P5Z4A3_9AGAR|nr:hypothetical protein BDN70DRAFT_975722 [Pholiota conissans]